MNTVEKSVLAETFDQLSSLLPTLNLKCMEYRTRIGNIKFARQDYLKNLTESTMPNLSNATYLRLLELQKSHPESLLVSPALQHSFDNPGLLLGFWPGPRFKQTLAMARVHVKSWLDTHAYADLADFNYQINALETEYRELQGQLLQVKDNLRLLKSALDNAVPLPPKQCQELQVYATHLRNLRQGVASRGLQMGNQGYEAIWACNLTPLPSHIRSYLLDELINLPDTKCPSTDEVGSQFTCDAPQDAPNHYHNHIHDLPGPDEASSSPPIVDSTAAVLGLASAGAIAYSLETHGAYS